MTLPPMIVLKVSSTDHSLTFGTKLAYDLTLPPAVSILKGELAEAVVHSLRFRTVANSLLIMVDVDPKSKSTVVFVRFPVEMFSAITETVCNDFRPFADSGVTIWSPMASIAWASTPSSSESESFTPNSTATRLTLESAPCISV